MATAPTNYAGYAGAATALANAWGSYEQGRIAKIGYQLQEVTLRNNIQIAQWAADDAIEAGWDKASLVRRKGRQTAGSQRARMAANGLDMTQGTSLRILEDTDYLTAQDEANVVQGAADEALAARMKGAGFNAQAGMARFQGDSINPMLLASGSLLTSGARVADAWYRYGGGIGNPARRDGYVDNIMED